jgi:xylulokinase
MTRTREAVLGIDIGTTSTKAVLVAGNGDVLAESEVEQEVSTPHPAWTEQDPEMWWASTRSAIGDVMRQAKNLASPVEVRGIGLSGQMHSSVFLDGDGKPIRPAILWSDGRTTPQCREIIEKMGLAGLHRTAGNLAVEGFTAPKVLWLRENEPQNYERLRTLLLPKDYIRYRLTGELATEPSDAITTLLFNVRERDWSREVLSTLDIPSSILPRVAGSTEVSGHVTPSVAVALGLEPNIPVVGGGGDNAAAAVGSGVVKMSRVQSSIGTSGTFLTPIERASVDEGMRLHTFCHCLPDQWYLMGVILSAGNSLRWLRDVLLPQNTEGAYDLLTSEAGKVAPGSEGLFFLPYLTGERTPHNDSSARGVFFGLHLGHTRAHMARAVMEGVCFAMRDSLELMRQLGASFEEIRAVGGGARSALWRQIQADVYGAPVTILGPAGGPSYGAALMAAVGVGILPSLLEAADDWLHVQEVAEPDPRTVAIYDETYGAHRQLYPALKNRFSETSALVTQLSGGTNQTD